MQHEGQLQWYTTFTISINVAIFLGLSSFLIYTHYQKLRCCFFRTSSDHNALNSPTQNTQDTNEHRATNSEREVVFTAYSMQPTQGCSWRQLYHNDLDWNLQIDAVLAFSSQCPSLRNIKPASGVIFICLRTQANTSRSGVFFAQPKWHYALKLTTFGLRLNLIHFFPHCFACILVPSLVIYMVYLSFSYFHLYILHSCICMFMLWYVYTSLIPELLVTNCFFII